MPGVSRYNHSGRLHCGGNLEELAFIGIGQRKSPRQGGNGNPVALNRFQHELYPARIEPKLRPEQDIAIFSEYTGIERFRQIPAYDSRK